MEWFAVFVSDWLRLIRQTGADGDLSLEELCIWMTVKEPIIIEDWMEYIQYSGIFLI